MERLGFGLSSSWTSTARRSLIVALGLWLGGAAMGCSESHGTDSDAGSDTGFIFSDATVFPDAGSPDAGSPDAGPVSCGPQDAHQITCPAGVCDGPDSYAWDGERCVTIDCGTCEGADCGRLPHSLAACEAAHATCEPALCRGTGGDWLFFTEECEHYVCGLPQLASCFVGRPVCNCGSGRSFGPAGCFDDTACPEVDPQPPEVVCGASGGTWTPGICCNTRCGVQCDLDCVAPACVCGEFEIFDAIRGCVPAAECFERGDGETCTNVSSRCEEGLICCQRCGGVGCEVDSFCHAPVCDADPDIDECGNNLRAP